MFGLDLLTTPTLGILASAVAGLITLVPALGLTDSRRAVVAIATIIVAVLAQDNFVFVSYQALLSEVLTAAVYSLVTYKMILQPLVLPAVNSTTAALGLTSK